MPGTHEGGKHAAKSNKERYGDDFYVRIGSMGGKKGRTGGFGSMNVGADGLTGPQRASVAGKKGGIISKRGPRIRVAPDSKTLEGDLNDS